MRVGSESISNMSQSRGASDGGDTGNSIEDVLNTGEDVLDSYAEKIEAGDELSPEEMDTWVQSNTLKGAYIALTRSDLSPDEVADSLEEIADVVRNLSVDPE